MKMQFQFIHLFFSFLLLLWQEKRLIDYEASKSTVNAIKIMTG